MPRRYKIFLWIASLTFLADQISKYLARRWLAYDEVRGYGTPVVVIENFFDWRMSYNTGSAFGLFRSVGGARIFLTIVGIVAVFAIVWMLRQARDDQRRFAWALGLVAGGAVGNVLDRILFGKVTDFVVWKWHQHEWPTFNVADAALCVGVGLLFLDMGRDKRAQADTDGAAPDGPGGPAPSPRSRGRAKQR
jgi:signal peptidase II